MNYSQRDAQYPDCTLRQYLNDKNVTQSELADQAHMTQAQINHYVTGKRTPGLGYALSISNSLGITLDELAKILGVGPSNKEA